MTSVLSVAVVSVSYKFGLVGMAAGALGVPLGCAAAARARPLVADADPLLCGAALLLSAPLVFCALIAVRASAAGTFALIFFGMLTLNLTWSVVADMILVSGRPPPETDFSVYKYSNEMRRYAGALRGRLDIVNAASL